MSERILSLDNLQDYTQYLIEEERSNATIEKYERDIRGFAHFLGATQAVSKERVLEYKEQLVARYATSSVNSMLTAINGILHYFGFHDCCVKLLKAQRRFCSDEKELTREEYCRLLKAAKQVGNERIGAIMQTICSTGIRVSELQYVTVESLNTGRANVRCKGKERRVLIPKELQTVLRQYCRRRKIEFGSIFITSSGQPMNRSNIWSAMKKLCESAEVPADKVFPHNLRHLFAITFYRLEKDIVHLADILGHSSVETTRIYTTTNGEEHRQILSRMNLVFGMR